MSGTNRRLRGLARRIWRTPSRHSEPQRTADLTPARTRVLIQFLTAIGAAMNGAGDPTTFVRRSLYRIGHAYGLRNIVIFVAPTLLLLRYGNDDSMFVDLSGRVPTDLRLDQVTALYHLVEEAESGALDPAEGLRRLDAIVHAPEKLNAAWRLIGCVLTVAGISLLLEPSLEELALCAGLGVVVGIIEIGGGHWRALWPLVPAASGLIVAAIAFALIDAGLDSNGARLFIPPLAIFLPGAAMTVSMIELANGDVMAGASRLAYGVVRLLLLVFGVVIAAQWLGLPPEAATPDTISIGVLGTIIGLVIFTTGVCLHNSAPRDTFAWLLLVVTAAWLGEVAGTFLLGGYLSGFTGGFVMILAARAIEAHRDSPPLIVSFTPAFWVLVPGTIGLEGLSHLAQDDPLNGMRELVLMVLTMVSIALGVLTGLVVSGSELSRDPARNLDA